MTANDVIVWQKVIVAMSVASVAPFILEVPLKEGRDNKRYSLEDTIML